MTLDALQQQSLADDGYSAAPTGDSHGRDLLRAGTKAPQTLAPSAHIRTHALAIHPGCLLASRDAFSADGAKILDGHAVARWNKGKRLPEWVGFWTT